MIEATLNAWAMAIGCDAQTLEKRIVKHGLDWKKGDKVSASNVLKAYYESPKDRLLLAQAEERERENKVANGLLLDRDFVERYTNERFISPLIAAMDAAPNDVDRDWLEKTLKPVLRGEVLPKKK